MAHDPNPTVVISSSLDPSKRFGNVIANLLCRHLIYLSDSDSIHFRTQTNPNRYKIWTGSTSKSGKEFKVKRTLALLLMMAAAPAALGQTTSVVVFKGALLIDGTGSPPIKKSILVIDGDKITAVGKEGKLHYPKNARVIDGEGRRIMPGIINGHGHGGLVMG